MRPSDMGSQFTPFYRAHDPNAQRLDKLTDEISGLREDIKGSHERMERSFNRLVAIMSQDRRSRSTLSRSSRGCLPALSYIPEPRYNRTRVREEVELRRGTSPLWNSQNTSQQRLKGRPGKKERA
jgi:hypothetical protein